MAQTHGAALRVVQIDVTSPSGKEAGRRLRWEFTPTFILVDGEGRELWRAVGALDPERVRRSLDALPQQP